MKRRPVHRKCKLQYYCSRFNTQHWENLRRVISQCPKLTLEYTDVHLATPIESRKGWLFSTLVIKWALMLWKWYHPSHASRPWYRMMLSMQSPSCCPCWWKLSSRESTLYISGSLYFCFGINNLKSTYIIDHDLSHWPISLSSRG